MARSILDLEIAPAADSRRVRPHHVIVICLQKQAARCAPVFQLFRRVPEQAFRRLIDVGDLIDPIAVTLPQRLPYRRLQSIEEVAQALIGDFFSFVQARVVDRICRSQRDLLGDFQIRVGVAMLGIGAQPAHHADSLAASVQWHDDPRSNPQFENQMQTLFIRTRLALQYQIRIANQHRLTGTQNCEHWKFRM